MPTPFAGFDVSKFWEKSKYAREAYVERAPTPAMIAEVQRELGVRLPASYVHLMKVQNGGIPRNRCFPTDTPTSWAEDHVAITGIFGIGKTKLYSLCGAQGSKFMQEEWGYPDIGICICDCPSAGHDMIMLDYRECGPKGEPQVVHVDQERDYEITFLARTFEEFIRGLVNESVYDTSEETRDNDLATVVRGKLSRLLSQVIRRGKDPALEKALRALCRRITEEKGHFSLHADPLSTLVYDFLFLLYSEAKPVKDGAAYLKAYPRLLVFGDGTFNTGGYAPGFVEDWWKKRRAARQIVAGEDGAYKFAPRARARVRKALGAFGLK